MLQVALRLWPRRRTRAPRWDVAASPRRQCPHLPGAGRRLLRVGVATLAALCTITWFLPGGPVIRVMAYVGVLGAQLIACRPIRQTQCACEACVSRMNAWMGINVNELRVALATAAHRCSFGRTRLAPDEVYLVQSDASAVLPTNAFASVWEYSVARMAHDAATVPVPISASSYALLQAIAARVDAAALAEWGRIGHGYRLAGPLCASVADLTVHFAAGLPLDAAARTASAALADPRRPALA